MSTAVRSGGWGEILSCLPEVIVRALTLPRNSALLREATELRLRRGRYQSLTAAGSNYVLSRDGTFMSRVYDPELLTEKQLRDCVYRLCDGSLFSCEESLRRGFVVKGGCRVGICGRGIVKNRIPQGFSEYDALNLRICRHIPAAAEELLRYIACHGSADVGGILVLSPPGVGKTTLLRSLCSALSTEFDDGGVRRGARLCILDEREEIYLPEAFKTGFADVLSGYPKAEGIELATRVMAPEYIVCDEIGSEREAEEIYRAAAGGVTFIASCHGNSVAELYRKPEMAKLLRERIFQTVCRLFFTGGRRTCDITRVEEEQM